MFDKPFPFTDGVIGHHNLTQIDQLQTSYNNLTKERGQLQSSYNILTKDRDQLMTSHNNLTKEKGQLQSSYNNLTKERDQLQSSYNNLTKEREQLQSSYNNLTKDRDQLQTERDFLSGRSTNLKQTCPEGWQKFESSWYFLSTETKTWKESREDCLERGADLVIINSDKEFLFNLNKGLWIGLTDSVTEATWRWVDGTPLTTPRYWHKPQPDNGAGRLDYGEEDCVEILRFTAKTANRTGGTFTARATNDRRFSSSFPANISKVTGGGAANSTVSLTAPASTPSGTDVL
ncbi:C-type lectin domain family 4 member M-like [Oncorhynchus mykiss]|uniref:C-type lectin domain family 4 member M-like n=1 Tax=Oncorhynchus mykiss TaxID=8022 RepID=UPI001878FE5C|nr:C-type lectin domain family 4 member M-like [Oncorhynchus mykiss]